MTMAGYKASARACYQAAVVLDAAATALLAIARELQNAEERGAVTDRHACKLLAHQVDKVNELEVEVAERFAALSGVKHPLLQPERRIIA